MWKTFPSPPPPPPTPIEPEWHLGTTTDITCPTGPTTETNSAQRSIYVEGRPRRLYIPSGTRMPNFRAIETTIQTEGTDWGEGEATDTRYSITYRMPIGITRDTETPDSELIIICGDSEYYTRATISGIYCKYFPESSYTTLTEDWIIYEE